jgi:hypothetical protein
LKRPWENARLYFKKISLANKVNTAENDIGRTGKRKTDRPKKPEAGGFLSILPGAGAIFIAKGIRMLEAYF